MLKKVNFFMIISSLLIFGLNGQVSLNSSKSESKILQLLSPEKSGISFSNTISHDVSTKANLFDFDYFYNGAGVGIADINNDGLEDIFFCGNQVPNKLYLNKGNLQFEDISEKAGINENKQWSNGITFADVNGDGYLDIYVSQGGPFESENRGNLLFINNQDLSFTEQSEAYGLNDRGLSTQSAFFDFDHDGDLDCVVMNENEYYGVDPIQFFQILLTDKERLWKNSSHFYRQDDGKFVDITEEAGLLRPSFGLGLVVSDINADGWEDIYMANDYYIPDVMFINNRKGKFVDRTKAMTSQLSFFGMGVDIADINNDLKQDIFVLDMASADHVRSKTLMASMNVENFNLLTETFEFPYQYMFNSLQLNQGNNQFRNIAHFAGAAKTDWSWTVLLEDLDNNQHKDIFITNGYRRYALDNDFKKKVFDTQVAYNGDVPVGIKDSLYDLMPTEKLRNLIYTNAGNLDFKESSTDLGLDQLTYSNGSAMADLDRDGDLEIVINNIDEEAFLYKNLSIESLGHNYLRVETKDIHSESLAKVYLFYGGNVQMQEAKRVRGYFSSSSIISHFGLGEVETIDSVVVVFPDGKTSKRFEVKANQTLTIEKSSTDKMAQMPIEEQTILKTIDPASLGLEYKHVENDVNDFEREVLLPYKQSTLGPFLSKADVNGDGISDLFIGGARGQAGQLYVSNETGYEPLYVPDFEIDKEHEDMASLFFDADSDGDLDLYVVSGGNSAPPNDILYKDRLYLNRDGNFFRSRKSLPDLFSYSGRSVAALDFDNDKDLDLVVGNRLVAQNYPVPGEHQILENRDGIFYDVTDNKSPQFKNFGLINKIITTDFDQDGLQDIIAVGEWTSIGLFRNTGKNFINVAQLSGLDSNFGLWFEIHETDANGDGKPDYIIGNLGKNSKFTASPEKPFLLFANDFDTNGTIDIVLSKVYKDEIVPVRGRECSSQQMPFIAEKFKSYQEFANASVYDIFEEDLNNSLQLQVNNFASIILLNEGNGKFKVHELPTFAQLFPLLDVAEIDVDQDGQMEYVLVGNIYNTEVETPRWDGGTGVMLSWDPEKEDYFTSRQLNLRGNIKSAETIKLKNGEEFLLVTRNDDVIGVYGVKEKAFH